MTKFSLKAQRPALVEGFDNEVHVLAKLIAPPAPKSSKNRKPLNLSIVIDRSGSMGGQPLEEAKKCATIIVNSLMSEDRISVVTYHSTSEVVVPSTQLIDKRSILALINEIEVGGQTDLHAGWLLGAEQVAKFKTKTSINRVLLLSDGAANIGLTEISEITPRCAQLADTGVTTSTYGLGRHFNEELMLEMAKSGQGQGYYGETAEDLEDPFREEFNLLANTMATNVEIFVEYPSFVSLDLTNSYIGKDPIWKLPNLAYEGEAWALFKLNINEKNLKDCKTTDILRSHLSYDDLDGKKVQTQVESIRLKPINQNAFGALVEDEEIKSRILEIRAASFQDRAREAANREDWTEVAVIMGEAKAEAGDNSWIAENLHALEQYAKRRETRAFSKEAMYSADKFRTRLSCSYEQNDVYNRSEENTKAMYLRRKLERGKRMHE